jgi:bifunctional non-homologous end joining protein LigD
MQPMRLLRIPQPFDHPDFIYELKLDGFRGLAVVDGGRCRLFSRNGYEFKHWCSTAKSSVWIPDGRWNFYSLLFRRGEPFFYAFDTLTVNDVDVRAPPAGS